ncbi:MAG: DUF5723 family protein [Vicingaceae bacterium]
MKKIHIILAFLCFTTVHAQQDLSMFNLNEIPQSSYSNPSNQFNGKFHIGIPALSSNYLSASNSGFAYSDFIRKNGDSLLADFDNMIKSIEVDNYLSFYSKIDLLSFGISINSKTQLMFNVSDNAYFRLSYPKDLMRFIYEGNAAFEDNTANLEGVGLSLNHYREYALGLSHQLNDKLRIGGRLKYLYGMENIYNERSDITVITDPETYKITANANLSIKTAGLTNDIDESAMEYLSGRGNSGLGIDLGANYQLNEKISLNASIIDLGYIKWKAHTKSYSNKGEFQYSGIEINTFAGEEGARADGETSFDRVLDSLEEAMNIDTSTASYSSPLTSRIYLGGNYEINERSFAGALFQAEVFQGNILPSFTLLYNRKMNKWIGLGASYTMINRTYNNLGLAVNFNPGPIQFYLVSDNLLGVFRPQHTRHLQVRFGINLIFGGDKSTQMNAAYKRGEKKKKKSDSSDS